MEGSRIPKNMLYSELSTGQRAKGCPQFRHKDVCKPDMEAVGINTVTWEGLAVDCSQWRSALQLHIKTGKDNLLRLIAILESH